MTDAQYIDDILRLIEIVSKAENLPYDKLKAVMLLNKRTSEQLKDIYAGFLLMYIKGENKRKQEKTAQDKNKFRHR